MSSIAKVIEVSSASSVSFHDAIEKGIAKASETVKNISGAWVKEELVKVRGGKITEWRVILKITFVID